jgi:hypothetical protein
LPAVGAPPALGIPRIDYFDQGSGCFSRRIKDAWATRGSGLWQTSGLAKERLAAHICGMPIECPNALCTVCVAIGDDGKLVFTGGQCIELLGTHYVHAFERCPFLARVVSRKFKFPDPKD